MEKICVAIRVRPPSHENNNRGLQWKVVNNTIALLNTAGAPVSGHTFAFDTIFGSAAKNINIYEEHAKDVVLSAVVGFNGTVFAYGQTSSGKTYTMRGSEAEPGITRLAVSEVFSHIRKIPNREFLIRVSYMEIYNEEINDLLAPDNRKLQIHENLERGIYVAGLREEIVDNSEQVLSLLESGEAQRHFGETNMNLYSSRSHSIFRMVIESRDKSQDCGANDNGAEAVRVSALNLVDLAGSERIAKTGAGGVRLKEGGHINKSLMCLGNVINKLCEGGSKQGHIPYRDSKLTRILQTALGGNARTAIICTMTPDEVHIDESRGTLQFASRAKRVTNCAQVNETLTDAALLKRQKKEIEELLQKLQGQGSSPHSDQLEKEIRNLRNDLLKFELEREKLELELQEEKKAQVDRERRIKEQERKIENLSTMVISSAVNDRDQASIKGIRRETWCPRQVMSEFGVQKMTRPIPEVETPPGFLDNLPAGLRRDRVLGLPPAFGSLNEDEGDSWRSPDGLERSPTPADFGNIADEDTWATLNGGHINDDLFNVQTERRTSSGVSEESSRSVLLEHQLRELQVQYEELQTSFNFKDLKLQQQLRTSMEEVSKLRQQVDSLTREKVKLEESLVQTQTNSSSSPALSDDYYVKKLEELVREMETELGHNKQENSRLRSEVQELRAQLFNTNSCLQNARYSRTELEHEIIMLRERLSFFEGRMQDTCVNSRGKADRAGEFLPDNRRSSIGTSEHDYLLPEIMSEGLCSSIHRAGFKSQRHGETGDVESVQSAGAQIHKHIDSDSESCQSFGRSRRVLKVGNGGEDVAADELFAMQQSSLLDQQLEIVQREKDRMSEVWMEQLTANDDSAEAMKAEKLWLAKELQNYIGTLAVQDEVVSAICTGIKEFETDIENRRRLSFY